MSKVCKGSDLMLFMDGKTLAFATSHKLSVGSDIAEKTSKDEGAGKWSSKTAKKIHWDISSENLFVENGDSKKKQAGFKYLFALMVSRTKVNIVFSRVLGEKGGEIPVDGWNADTSGRYEGKAYITSLEANAPNGENATYSITMEGVGELKHISEVACFSKGVWSMNAPWRMESTWKMNK